MALKDVNGNYMTNSDLGNIGYEYDYYCGSQTNVMFGDVLIDNAVHIGFSAQQTKAPVSGFASQYYNFMAPGKVFIQGELTIAFKEAGYLMWPIQRYLFRKANESTTTPRYRVNDGQVIEGAADSTNDSLVSLAEEARHKRTIRANVEQMMQWSNRTNQVIDADGKPGGSTLRSNSGYNRFVKDLGALDDRKFEDFAESFEDAIWFGSDTGNPYARDKLNSNNLELEDFVDSDYSNANSDEQIFTHRRLDQYPEIDIWITYGDVNKQSANHTVKKLLDVSFTGQGQVIEISGAPVLERYSFIAKNLV